MDFQFNRVIKKFSFVSTQINIGKVVTPKIYFRVDFSPFLLKVAGVKN